MRTLLALLGLVPALAIAQPADAPTPDAPPPPPGWSLGAGVSTADYLLYGTSPLPAYGAVGSLGVSYPVVSTSVPAVVASIEHAIGDRAWFFFGVTASGAWNDYETNAPPSSTSGFLRHAENQSGAVELGVRGEATPDGSPVTVSWLGSVEAGVAHAKGAAVFGTNPTQFEQRYEVRALSANVGLAVDRALGDRLVVRVATPLARVFYSDGEQRIESPGAGPVLTKAKSVGASFVVAPRL